MSISAIATECGVTQAQVEETALLSHVTEQDGMTFAIMPMDASPALAGETARFLFDGEAEFSHLGMSTYPVYKKVS